MDGASGDAPPGGGRGVGNPNISIMQHMKICSIIFSFCFQVAAELLCWLP